MNNLPLNVTIIGYELCSEYFHQSFQVNRWRAMGRCYNYNLKIPGRPFNKWRQNLIGYDERFSCRIQRELSSEVCNARKKVLSGVTITIGMVTMTQPTSCLIKCRV